jgi:small ligand-binding sensory domain FIST
MAEAAGFVSGDFRAAVAAGDSWALTAKACIERLGELPDGANLGMLYATGALAGDFGSALTFLRECTGVQHWVGTVGMGVAGSGVEHHDRPALAVMVAALPEDSFRIFEPVSGSLDQFRQQNMDWVARHRPVFGIVHGDPRNQQIARIVADLAAETSTFMVGGLSAAPDSLPQIADTLVDGGLSGVLFSSELQVVTGLSQGCTPIGPARRVTESEQNVIKTIDDRPALEVFKEDIGELLARDLRRVSGYIYVAFPIPGTDTGDYLVRNLIGIDLERSWIAVGELVEKGRSLMFCRRDHDAAKQDLQRMLGDVKERAGGPAKAAVYYSCVARGPNLFGPDSEELKLVRDELGDIPLVGFFANGEISNNRLYGYTGVLALFL